MVRKMVKRFGMSLKRVWTEFGHTLNQQHASRYCKEKLCRARPEYECTLSISFWPPVGEDTLLLGHP